MIGQQRGHLSKTYLLVVSSAKVIAREREFARERYERGEWRKGTEYCKASGKGCIRGAAACGAMAERGR